jgi:UDP-N-acetylmuramate dehydrogenase
MSLRTDIKALLRHNVRLAQYCTMQVGGLAKYFAEPSTEEELLDLVEFARHENIPYFILGKGSNVIFPDEGYPGLVITMIHFDQDRILFDQDKPVVTVSAGVHLYRLVVACRDHRLGGAEFLCNIPGTVGGALIMNGGFSRFPGQKSEIGDITEEVTVINQEGKKEIINKKDLEFSYRHSNLAGKIVLSGTFRLWYRKSEEIQKEIRANFDYRNSKQDLKHPSSGSIFKNPAYPTQSAGKLIDGLGLKGTKVGGAMVSLLHGNYIVNAGQAKSSDIVQLIHQLQKMVFDATGILLEPEVRIIEKP